MPRKGFVLSVSGMTPKVMERVSEAIEYVLEDLSMEGVPFFWSMVTDVKDGSEIEIRPPKRSPKKP